ncbi:hypothetical protein SAMN04487950_2344 [Halogranum rubrum]|uniref:Uncharacterized protein n=1 Tax=Halogranum rubrum TaxID=553466 RepID=A0A1I4EUK0_9EURY|nr:hypothetical protein [Halogranum rubrum]SFL08207.1 hypothetical protein SAMN04487950_2344 [Halogranum rubrum]
MADVARDRAQLFLIGALSLAITFVVLALVLNSAIYTENLATRGADQTGATDALSRQHDVRTAVGSVVDRANDQQATYDDQESAIGAAIVDTEVLLRQYEVRSTALLRVENPVYTRGARIQQTVDSPFDGPSGSGDWTVASGVQTRQFSLTATRASLEDEADDDAFRVRFDDGTDVWTVRIFRNEPGTATVVRVTDPSGATVECLDDSGSETTVVFSTATVGGGYCRGLAFLDELGTPYDVRFGNPTEGSGTYSLLVDKTVSGLGASYSAPDGDPPASEAIYAVTVDLTYRTPDLTYETELRVAPGEFHA